jgi:hypothetical protein
MPFPLLVPVVLGLSALGISVPLLMGGKKKGKKGPLPDADPVLAEVEAEIEGDAVIVADPYGQVGAIPADQVPDEVESWNLPPNWRAYFTLAPLGVTQAQLKAAAEQGANTGDLSEVSLVGTSYVRVLAFDEEGGVLKRGQKVPGLPAVIVDIEELLTVPELEEDAEAADELLAEAEADDGEDEDIDDAAEALAEEDAAEVEELKQEVATDGAPPNVVTVPEMVVTAEDAEAADELLAEAEADDGEDEDIDDAAEALAEEDAAEVEELKEEVQAQAPADSRPADSLGLGRLLLDAERRTGWKTAHAEQVRSWQAARNLTPDARFGPASALLMAAEIGVAPIVRYWPKEAWGVGSPPYVEYIQALKALNVDSNRERGQGFGTPPKPITTFAQV